MISIAQQIADYVRSPGLQYSSTDLRKPNEGTTARVLACFSDIPQTAAGVHKATGISNSVVTQAMRQLRSRGLIVKSGTLSNNTNSWVLA